MIIYLHLITVISKFLFRPYDSLLQASQIPWWILIPWTWFFSALVIKEMSRGGVLCEPMVQLFGLMVPRLDCFEVDYCGILVVLAFCYRLYECFLAKIALEHFSMLTPNSVYSACQNYSWFCAIDGTYNISVRNMPGFYCRSVKYQETV